MNITILYDLVNTSRKCCYLIHIFIYVCRLISYIFLYHNVGELMDRLLKLINLQDYKCCTSGHNLCVTKKLLQLVSTATDGPALSSESHIPIINWKKIFFSPTFKVSRDAILFLHKVITSLIIHIIKNLFFFNCLVTWWNKSAIKYSNHLVNRLDW